MSEQRDCALLKCDAEGSDVLVLRGARQTLQGENPPLDIAAAADAAVALTRLAAARPDIAEIEINPLLVLPHGALALDARIIPVEGEGDAR